MPTWPAALPDDMFLGLTLQEQDSVIRSQMDAGPPSRRQRFTAVPANIDVPLVLTGDQKRVFDSWFREELLGGAIAFSWESPDTDAVDHTFAFRSPPRWSLTRGGVVARRVWRTTLELERQP